MNCWLLLLPQPPPPRCTRVLFTHTLPAEDTGYHSYWSCRHRRCCCKRIYSLLIACSAAPAADTSNFPASSCAACTTVPFFATMSARATHAEALVAEVPQEAEGGGAALAAVAHHAQLWGGQGMGGGRGGLRRRCGFEVHASATVWKRVWLQHVHLAMSAELVAPSVHDKVVVGRDAPHLY